MPGINSAKDLAGTTACKSDIVVPEIRKQTASAKKSTVVTSVSAFVSGKSTQGAPELKVGVNGSVTSNGVTFRGGIEQTKVNATSTNEVSAGMGVKIDTKGGSFTPRVSGLWNTTTGVVRVKSENTLKVDNVTIDARVTYNVQKEKVTDGALQTSIAVNKQLAVVGGFNYDKGTTEAQLGVTKKIGAVSVTAMPTFNLDTNKPSAQGEVSMPVGGGNLKFTIDGDNNNKGLEGSFVFTQPL